MKTALWILAGVLAVLLIIFFVIKVPDRDLQYLTEKYTDSDSRFIQVEGINVHYKKEGSGPTLVLIHGTASSLHTWDQWTLMLKDYYTIIRMDLPAFGLTGPNQEGDYSMKYYSDFIDQFLDQLSVDSCFIAGNSLGGAIAWNYTLDHPEVVKKLILIDASGYPKEGIPLVFQLARNPFSSFLLKHITPRSFIEKNIKEVYHQDELITEDLINRYYELSLRPGNRQAFIDRANLNYIDRSDEINKIDCPTLIQWGENDLWIPLVDGKRFNAEIENSSLIIYKNAGHVPMEEIPLQTSSDAANFLMN